MPKTSDGKIVAQVHYASRLPRIQARQDYLRVILPRIQAPGREKCDCNHSIIMQISYHNMIINAGAGSVPPEPQCACLFPKDFNPRRFQLRVPLAHLAYMG
jgi:hypothetical protein